MKIKYKYTNSIHEMIDSYGENLTQDLLEIMIIKKGKILNSELRDLLIKHKVITKSTKTITHRYECWKDYNNILVYSLIIKNGRGSTLICAYFTEEQLKTQYFNMNN